ncbi:hypothetical protein B0H14DRAFT_2575979 [Mycena olivaceomarginata]|nr:hypothetical protein B0H14DRAFT_2575979 [Mycena olivaceomarginata]
MSTEALEDLAGQLGNLITPDFTSTFQNVFQVIYHLLRVDLGVILDNQIYNSSQMFNVQPQYYASESSSQNHYYACESFALWAIFSLGAGALARRTDSGWDMGTLSSFAFKEFIPTHIRLEHLEADMGGVKHDIGGMKHDMREMKHMVRLLLGNQGLTDDRLDQDLRGIQLSHLNILEALPLMHLKATPA